MGQHTEEVLREKLGLVDEDLATLRDKECSEREGLAIWTGPLDSAAAPFYCGLGWGAPSSCEDRYDGPPLGYVFWVAIIAALIRPRSAPFAAPGPAPVENTSGTTSSLAGCGQRQRGWYTTVECARRGIGVVLGLTPIFTYGISLAMRLETFAALRATGLSFGFVGVVMFVVPSQSLPDPAMIPWMLFGLGAPLTYALANILIDRMRPKTGNTLSHTTGMVWFGAIFMLPVCLLAGAFHVPAFPPSGPDIGVWRTVVRVSHSSRYSR